MNANCHTSRRRAPIPRLYRLLEVPLSSFFCALLAPSLNHFSVVPKSFIRPTAIAHFFQVHGLVTHNVSSPLFTPFLSHLLSLFCPPPATPLLHHDCDYRQMR